MSTLNIMKSDKKEIITKINEIKNKVDENYTFLNLSKDFTSNLFQNVCNKLLNQERFIDLNLFLDKLEKEYNLEYQEILKDKILNDNTREILQDYINCLLTSTEVESYEKLLIFSKELNSSLTYLDVEDYKFLLNNTILRVLIKECIADDKIDLLLDTPLYPLITLYFNNNYLLEERDYETDNFQTNQLGAYTYIGTIPSKILTAEEEKYFFEQVLKGNKEAKEYLIKHNLRLVISIAKDYQNRGLDLDDLIQEGNIGLMKAIDRFDISKGVRFSTYATAFISNSIKTSINCYGRTIRIPISLRRKINELNKTKVELNNILGREATKEELAKKLGISVKKVEDLINASIDTTSYNVQVDKNNDDFELIDFVRDDSVDIEDNFLKTNLQENILEILDTLNEKERYVLIHHFGLNNEKEETLEQIGKHLNVRGERIRQIEKAALKKLKKQQKVRNSVNYLDKVIDLSKEEKMLHIYDYFKNSQKYLFSAFSYLEENEVHYLKNIYGEYFDKKALAINTLEFKELIDKLDIITKALKKESYLTLSDLTLVEILRMDSKEEVFCLMEKLNQSDQDILIRKYPNGIDNAPKELAYPLEVYFVKGIIKKMKALKEQKKSKVLLKKN